MIYGCTIETKRGDCHIRIEASNTDEAWQLALEQVERGERLISLWLLGSRRTTSPPPKPKVLRMDEKTKRDVAAFIKEWRRREHRYSADDCARVLEDYLNNQKPSRRPGLRKSRESN